MDNAHLRTGPDLVALTAELASAYVAHNPVQRNEVPDLIAAIYTSLAGLGAPKPEPESDRPVPAVPIKKSISHDHLISLEDGRRYKSLKRHLAGRGLTPVQYREKWGLAKDYPMVAPNYAKQRSELAKALGLGQQRRKRGSDEAAPQNAAAPADATPVAPRKRGRPRSTPKADA